MTSRPHLRSSLLPALVVYVLLDQFAAFGPAGTAALPVVGEVSGTVVKWMFAAIAILVPALLGLMRNGLQAVSEAASVADELRAIREDLDALKRLSGDRK